MSDYIIITDSSCDLPHSLVQELELRSEERRVGKEC